MPSSNRTPGHLGKALAWLCLGVSCALIVIHNAPDALLETRYGQLFDGWRATTGTITMSKAYQQRVGKYRTESRVFVEYEYRVDGRRYEGTRIRWGDPIVVSGDGERADNAAHILYPPGKSITVYHAPDAPQVSLLDKTKVYSGAPHQRTALFWALPMSAGLFFGLRHLWRIGGQLRGWAAARNSPG